MADYPSSIYSPREKVNKPGVVFDSGKSDVGYAEDVVGLDDEVVAMENELGLNPKGSSADIAERIKGIRSLSGASADIIIIDNSDEVGISIANPIAKLHAVTAVSNGSNKHGFVFQSGNNNGLDGGFLIRNFLPRFILQDTSTSAHWFDWRVNGTKLILGHGLSTNLFSRPGDNYLVVDPNGLIGIGTSSPAVKLDVRGSIEVNVLAKITDIGGYAIKLINRTGSNTVQGDVVQVSTANTDAVIKAVSNSEIPIGVFLDSGIADGSRAWVVISGIADVHSDTTGFSIGDWLRTDTVPGRVDGGSPAPDPVKHTQEIGHAVESAVGSGLGRAVLHFN